VVAADVQAAALAGASGLEGQARQVLTLLAAGLKDEAIARRLGTTTRTVRRLVQEAMTALDARSRFNVGVEASRRGWI
jgi:DNA-binding NarL/FixJ family response regulator